MKRAQAIALSVLGGAVLVAGSFSAGRPTSGPGEASMTAAPAASGAGDRKVLYWHDPMVPGQRFDKPGKSPFMDMQLVPVYAGGDGDQGSVTISPRVQQNLGVRTAEVKRGAVQPVVE